ncbi:hypothetical protein LSTR_LSTR010263 [Laodelphax striatellus]|uniref:Uncharacterized protein n=1 Tax=Laodelphax striatellus TaxID=195883 RepID=A0A482XS23_LAOST|nr:hypothetical protein LSTR_LSTR010263 [Laodelphax striatellus]
MKKSNILPIIEFATSPLEPVQDVIRTDTRPRMPASTVAALRGDNSLSALIPDISNVVKKKMKTVESQTDPPWQSARYSVQRSSPTSPFGRVPPMPGQSFGPERVPPPIDPFAYGRSNLPFGSGEGMLFDPLGGGRRPRIPGMAFQVVCPEGQFFRERVLSYLSYRIFS